jgi:hypothetical protein
VASLFSLFNTVGVHIVINIHHKHSLLVKIKQMQYLCYNANKWLQQSLDLKAMVDSNGAANTIIESHFN